MEVGYRSGEREDEGDDDFDWSCREGWSMFVAQGIWWYFKVTAIEIEDEKFRCEALDERDQCKLWDTDQFKPICRYWPFHPSNLEKFPQCGFTFERQEENENQA